MIGLEKGHSTTCEKIAVVSLFVKREGIVMLEVREVQIVDDKFVVDVGEIRDALLHVSILVKIRGCVGLFLHVRQLLRPRWSREPTDRLICVQVRFWTIDGADAA